MRVIFVGIHNKPGLKPLCDSTRSGKLIDRVIEMLPKDDCIKTNLFEVESIPEGLSLFMERHKWAEKYKPEQNDIAVLLGKRVQKLFFTEDLCRVVKVPHPAAIWSKVSQKRYIDHIINEITELGWESINDNLGLGEPFQLNNQESTDSN